MTDKQIIIDVCPYQGECSVSGCKRNDDGCFVRQLFEERDRAENRIVELNKTIKAKEQECEELKKDVIEALKLVEITSTHNTFQETKINRLSKTLTEIKDFFKEECLICKENYINIIGEICEECKYQDILKKINEVE